VTAHVLLVEDNFADVSLIEEVLLDLPGQYEMHVVENGVDALAFLRGEAPFISRPTVGLVLLDLNTPLLGGFELLEAVRAEESWADMRLVVFSSSHHPEDERRSLAMGADAYVVKPTGWDQFSGAVQDIFARWAAASSP